jgi:hypothetical protein
MAAGMDPSIAITQVQGVAQRYCWSPVAQGLHPSLSGIGRQHGGTNMAAAAHVIKLGFAWNSYPPV